MSEDERKALEQALAAMRAGVPTGKTTLKEWYAAIAAAEAALAESEQEPVAWRLCHRLYLDKSDAMYDWRHDPTFDNTGYVPEPLYARPVRAEPLTEEEINEISLRCMG